MYINYQETNEYLFDNKVFLHKEPIVKLLSQVTNLVKQLPLYASHMKGKRMSIIEIDTGTQIEKYEYIGEDIDTYIVSSDDIDLSKEGFILKQKVSKQKLVEKNQSMMSCRYKAMNMISALLRKNANQ